MDKKNVDYSLYLCTDSALMSRYGVEKTVYEAVTGGVTAVQLREKNASSREFFELAVRLRKITVELGVPLIINDRLDIALAADADGAHLGQSDLPCSAARKILGEEKIIGVTAPTVEAAKAAQRDGADYIGVGAMFKTSTKSDAKINTFGNLAAIRSAVKIPIVAIGGIKRSNILKLKGSGINGAAVISDIACDESPSAAAAVLRELIKKI